MKYLREESLGLLKDKILKLPQDPQWIKENVKKITQVYDLAHNHQELPKFYNETLSEFIRVKSRNLWTKLFESLPEINTSNK